MKIINKNLRREDLTRAKKSTRKFVAPKKDINEDNINVAFEGNYLVISKNPSNNQSNTYIF